MLNRLRSVFRQPIQPDPPRVRVEPVVKREIPAKPDWAAVSEQVREKVADAKELFKAYTPPKGVQGEKQHALAMDSAAVNSAVTLGVFANAVADGTVFLGYPRLAAMAQRVEYRNMVEILASESVREWIEFTATGSGNKGDRIKQLEAEFIRLNVRSVMRHMAEHDGYYGIGLLYVETGLSSRSADLATPLLLRPETFRVGSLERLTVVDPNWAAPNEYNTDNPLNPDFYRPSEWWVQGASVHSSRLLRFVSREVPDILKPAYNFGGLALIQAAKPYVDNWLRTRQSVSDLINAFSIVALSTDMSAYAQDPEGLIGRIDAFNRFRSNRGTFLLDKDKETLQILSASLAGLDKLQAQAQEQMCSAAQEPLVKFTGITPSGLNASSDGEIKVWYDRVAAYQNQLFRQNLTTIMHMCMLNLWGEIDHDINFDFVPLEQMSEAERLDNETKKAGIDSQYIADGVVSNAEVRSRVINDPESIYAGTVTDADNVPPPPDEGDGTDDEPEPSEIDDVTGE